MFEILKLLFVYGVLPKVSGTDKLMFNVTE